MLQYSKDSGDIHLFLRRAWGLTPKKLQYTYTLPKNISPWCKAPRKSMKIQNSDQQKARGLIPANTIYSIKKYLPWFNLASTNKENRHRNTRGLGKTYIYLVLHVYSKLQFLSTKKLSTEEIN